MKCKYCGDDMVLIHSMDNGGGCAKIDIAYSIYECEDCLSTLRVDVWNGAGERWISPQNEDVSN